MKTLNIKKKYILPWFLFVCHSNLSCLMKTWNIASRIVQSTFLILLWCFCILYWTGKLQLQGKGIILLLAPKCLLSCYTEESQLYVFGMTWSWVKTHFIFMHVFMLVCRTLLQWQFMMWVMKVALKRCDIPLFNDEQHDTTWSRSITPFIELHQIVWKEKHKLTFCSEMGDCSV